MIPKPEINYLELRPKNLFSKKFNHILLLLYWPIYGIIFSLLENHPDKDFNIFGIEFQPMWIPLDDLIPFNELFVIPYVFWFGYIVIALVYTFFYDVDTYKRYMYFIMITYSIALISYIFFPTEQNLRPEFIPRDNFLVDFMRDFWDYDTSTNVCPSVHVIGSFAATFAFQHSKGISNWVKAGCQIMNVLICLSTVFLKQHSAIDGIIGTVICIIVYVPCFLLGRSNDGNNTKNPPAKKHKKPKKHALSA
ncbi:MAG: phosphatidic acid phosphatase [Ruminococcaceae bacterium]|nr:phosphatidic acid phosphatase [Oscillospiraceae bacterium]